MLQRASKGSTPRVGTQRWASSAAIPRIAAAPRTATRRLGVVASKQIRASCVATKKTPTWAPYSIVSAISRPGFWMIDRRRAGMAGCKSRPALPPQIASHAIISTGLFLTACLFIPFAIRRLIRPGLVWWVSTDSIGRSCRKQLLKKRDMLRRLFRPVRDA